MKKTCMLAPLLFLTSQLFAQSISSAGALDGIFRVFLFGFLALLIIEIIILVIVYFAKIKKATAKTKKIFILLSILLGPLVALIITALLFALLLFVIFNAY